MNSFQSRNRILSVERQWLADAGNSGWSICLEYSISPSNTAGNAGDSSTTVDYREYFSADDFEVFRVLREERNAIAKSEGVAAYVVCTNAQLAAMVETLPTTKAELIKIPKFGPARVEKYGDQLLSVLARILESRNETAGQSDEQDSRSGESSAGSVVRTSGKTKSE